MLFVFSFAAAIIVLGPIDGGVMETPLWHLALVLLPLIPGAFALNAYLQFLKEADELVKRVHFEAASNSFCIVIMLGFIFSLAGQIFGQWEDSGAFLWIIGLLTYQASVNRTWAKLNE